jgi:hypothetical protein
MAFVWAARAPRGVSAHAHTRKVLRSCTHLEGSALSGAQEELERRLREAKGHDHLVAVNVLQRTGHNRLLGQVHLVNQLVQYLQHLQNTGQSCAPHAPVTMPVPWHAPTVMLQAAAD